MNKKYTEVYFQGNFWGHDESETPAVPISFEKEFFRDERLWYIPNLYISASGLVIDFCIRITPEEFNSFIDKWDLKNKSEEDFSEDDLLRIEADNPCTIYDAPEISLNGKKLSFNHSSSITFNPCLGENNIDDKSKELVSTYSLDNTFCWVFIRAAFDHTDVKTEDIKTLDLKLVPNPIAFPGEHFSFSKEGDTKEVTNPVSGKKYILTFIEAKENTVSFERFNQDVEPLNYLKISYTISPDISDEYFSVYDCEKRQSNFAFSVIGTEENTYVAASIPMYKKRKLSNIEWRCVFYEKKSSDYEISFKL